MLKILSLMIIYNMLPSNIQQRIASYLSDKKIVLLGFGKEGQSTLRFLLKHHLVEEVAIADRRTEAELMPIIKQNYLTGIKYTFHSGDNYLECLDDYELVIKSPGIFDFAKLPAAKKEKIETKLTSQIEMLLNFSDFTTIGITGTKGKSTTSKLLAEILQRDKKPVHLLGNIGTPAFELLHEFNQDSIAVTELSSYQTEYLTRGPNIAVILNLYEEHLDFHGTVSNYHLAKWNLTSKQSSDDFLILRSDSHTLKSLLQEEGTKAQVLYFDITDTNEFEESLRFSVLRAEHNRWNLAAAVAVCKLLKVSTKSIATAITHFEPLPHRLQQVGIVDGIRFYDDSISTTVESTIAALEAIPEVETLLLGGQDRGIDYDLLIHRIKEDKRIKNLVLFPDSGNRIYSDLTSENRLTILRTDDMLKAVRFARQNTSKGKAVVLSPAAPSYNKYANYIERGEDFMNAISKI